MGITLVGAIYQYAKIWVGGVVESRDSPKIEDEGSNPFRPIYISKYHNKKLQLWQHIIDVFKRTTT